MGRGRQKAKQQKIARKLKYLTTDTDYDELAKELKGEEPGTESVDPFAGVEGHDEERTSPDSPAESSLPADDLDEYARWAAEAAEEATAAARTLYSLPVYVSPAMAAGSAFIVSKSDLIAAVGTIGLTTSAEAAFTADSLVHRITWRIGWNAVHPNRFAKIAITLPTQG